MTPRDPKAPLHVLQIVGNGIVGGMETVVLRLLERLPRTHFKLTVMCPYEGAFSERVRALGVYCLAVPMPDDPPWTVVQATCALIRSTGVDVVHAHLSNAHALAALCGGLTGRPVLATLHGRQVNMFDLEAHHAGGTHINTVCTASKLHALGVGVVRERLSCIDNGVDTQLFRPREPAGSVGTAEATAPGIPEGVAKAAVMAAPAGPVIGFVGRLSPEKGPEVFVRAAVLLRERLRNARFVIAGDGPLKQRLEQLLSQHRMSGRFTLTGVHDDMPGLYRKLDLLVSTSFSEAMPLALMEGMASGLPLVATRVGGVPDLLEHGQTGWLCDPGHVEGIAAAIEHLADNPAERLRMGQRARERAVARFDLERSVAATAALLQRLAGERHGSAAAVPVKKPVVAVTAPRRSSAAPKAGNGRAPVRATNGHANGHAGTNGHGKNEAP